MSIELDIIDSELNRAESELSKLAKQGNPYPCSIQEQYDRGVALAVKLGVFNALMSVRVKINRLERKSDTDISVSELRVSEMIKEGIKISKQASCSCYEALLECLNTIDLTYKGQNNEH